MAPEQTGRSEGIIDARTDVYGLGATLYHLITGQPPFTGSPDESIKQIRQIRPAAAVDPKGILRALKRSP